MARTGRHEAQGVLAFGALLAAAAIVVGCGGSSTETAKESRVGPTGEQQTPSTSSPTGTAKQVHVMVGKSAAAFRRELDAACHEVKARFVEAEWNGGAINAQGSMGIAGLESLKPPPSLAAAFRSLIHDLEKRHVARSYAGGNAYPKQFALYKRQYKLIAAKVRADVRGIGGLPSCPWPMAPPGHSVFSP